MTPSPHSDQLALPLTAPSEEPMSLLHCYTAFLQKRDWISPAFAKPLESKSTLGGPPPQFSLQPYSREEGTPPLWSGCHQFWIQMQGCQMRSPKESIRRRQQTAFPHLSSNLVTAPPAVVCERCRGLFTAALWWHQRLPSETSGCCYCSAPSMKMLHKADVRGTKTGTKCWNHTDRDSIVIRLIP